MTRRQKSSGCMPTREMRSVCWRSLTPLGDRRSGCWGDKHVLSAPLWVRFYLSEPTLLPLLLLRRLDLLMMIPKDTVFTVIWGHVEVAQAQAINILFGCLSMTFSRWYRKPRAMQSWELWDGPCSQLVPLRPHSAPARLSQGRARHWGDVSRAAQRWTYPQSWSSPVAWHILFLLQRGEEKAERDGEHRVHSFSLSPGGCII